jgi:cell division protein FtsL
MFLETTPDTSGYMIAGFAVAFITMGLYVISMYIRNQNLQRDLETLEAMKSEKPKKKK